MQKIILKDNHSDAFKLITYPDGQHSIRLNFLILDVKEPVNIICRIKNFSELEVLLCLIGALTKNDFYIDHIEFVYLFGMRSDRAFFPGEPNYFRQVVTPILNMIPIRKVIFHPHSEKNVIDLINTSFYRGPRRYCTSIDIGGDESSGLYHCFKKKREHNEIKVHLPDKTIEFLFQELKTTPVITIYDDLLDGGETFIQESIYLNKIFGKKIKLLNLHISHGLFSKGVDHVANHFDHIYCTNSYQEITHPKVTCIDVF